jgi:L-lactate dehydrogenase
MFPVTELNARLNEIDNNPDEYNDVYIGMPAILNEKGVERRIKLDLTPEEEKELQHSINVIKDNIKSI